MKKRFSSKVLTGIIVSALLATSIHVNSYAVLASEADDVVVDNINTVTEAPTEEIAPAQSVEETQAIIPTGEVTVVAPTEEIPTVVPTPETPVEVPVEESPIVVPTEENQTEVPTNNVVDETSTEDVAEEPTNESVEDSTNNNVENETIDHVEEDATEDAENKTTDETFEEDEKEVKEDEESDEEEKEEEEEEEEEAEEEILYPAQTFEPQSVGSVTVEANVNEGVFPEGTKMYVYPVSGYVQNQIKEGLSTENSEVVDVLAVDITFKYKDEEIQPSGNVNVSMHTERTVGGQNHKAVHLEDSGNIEVVAEASSDGAEISAEHFSVYAIIGIGDGEYQEEVTQYVRYTYNFYNGENLVSTQIVTDGDYLVEPSVPDSTGNNMFAGWKIRSTDDFIDFDSPITITETNDQTFNVDATFEETFKVYFYIDELESAIFQMKTGTATDVISTTDIVLANTATTKFDGWYVKGDSLRTPVSSVTIVDSNIELYPILTSGIWVNFNSMGGSYVESQFIEVGTAVEEPTAPTKIGYSLVGWYTSQASAENLVTADKFNFSTTIDSSMTLYAGWQAQTVSYKVRIWTENPDDDGYSVFKIITRTGTTGSTVPINNFNNIETLDANCVPCFDFNETKTLENVKTINGDGTTVQDVYFTRHIFTVGFYMNNNLIFTIPNVKAGANYTDRYIAEKNNHPEFVGTGLRLSYIPEAFSWTEDTSDQLGLNTATSRSNYNSYVRPHKDNNGVLRIDRTNTNLYTYYTIYCREKLDDETTPDGAQLVQVNNKTYYYTETKIHKYSWTSWQCWEGKRGSKFVTVAARKGENLETVVQMGSVNSNYNYVMHYPNEPVYELQDRQSNTLSFNENGIGTYTVLYEGKLEDYEPSNYIVNETTKTIGTKTYKFAGWYDNDTFEETPVDFSTARMPGNDLVLYAKWEAINYTVTFEPNNGDSSTSVVVESGDTVDRPADPTKDGYVFVGWKKANGHLFNFGDPITADITLTAQYQALSDCYKVAYDAGSDGEFTLVDTNYYLDGSNVTIIGTPTVTNDGKIFAGWKIGNHDTLYKSGLFTIHAVDAVLDSESNKVITLVAQYVDKPEKTTIIYNANGGIGTTYTDTILVDNNETKTVLSLSDVGFSAAYTLDRFVCWNTKADGTGLNFYPGETVAVNNTDDLDRTLYAIWGRDLIVNKKDNQNNLISGSLFKVTIGSRVIYIGDATSTSTEWLTEYGDIADGNANGILNFNSLKYSSNTITPEYVYTLEEIESPDGYYKLETPIQFCITQANGIHIINLSDVSDYVTMSSDGTTISVTNIPYFTLPKTGGIGNNIFYIVGMVTMATVGIVMYRKKLILVIK